MEVHSFLELLPLKVYPLTLKYTVVPEGNLPHDKVMTTVTLTDKHTNIQQKQTHIQIYIKKL